MAVSEAYILQFYLIAVRQKVKEMIALLQDNSRLREERRKAKKTKDKYIGVSSAASASRYSKHMQSSFEPHVEKCARLCNKVRRMSSCIKCSK